MNVRAADPVDGDTARGHQMYDLGETTIFASRADPRFSYALYVPPKFDQGQRPVELVVAMHGTGRSFIAYRDAFAEFGRWNNCIVLCPLFPAGVRGDDNRDGFKYILEADIRYDLALIDMVEQVAERYGLAFERFALFGYSGGGHFAHRFLILHPRRLWAASIGAPGSVTLLDPARDWWVGVRGIEERFGVSLDLDGMREVPVHMVVGGADLETWEITHRQGGRYFMSHANDAGTTRIQRLESLRRSFEAAGISVRFDLMPGVSHDGLRCVEPVKTFLADCLTVQRARRG